MKLHGIRPGDRVLISHNTWSANPTWIGGTMIEVGANSSLVKLDTDSPDTKALGWVEDNSSIRLDYQRIPILSRVIRTGFINATMAFLRDLSARRRNDRVRAECLVLINKLIFHWWHYQEPYQVCNHCGAKVHELGYLDQIEHYPGCAYVMAKKLLGEELGDG